MTDYALGKGGGRHSHEPTGQTVYWQTSVKNLSAHSRWVICVSDHSDGPAQTSDISFAVRNGFPSYLDGDLECVGSVCACTRWCAASSLVLCSWSSNFLFIFSPKVGVSFTSLKVRLLINLPGLAVKMGGSRLLINLRQIMYLKEKKKKFVDR